MLLGFLSLNPSAPFIHYLIKDVIFKLYFFRRFLLTLFFLHDKLYSVDTEVYPSLAEGIGLENRQGSKIPRGFESLYLLHFSTKTRI